MYFYAQIKNAHKNRWMETYLVIHTLIHSHNTYDFNLN